MIANTRRRPQMTGQRPECGRLRSRGVEGGPVGGHTIDGRTVPGRAVDGERGSAIIEFTFVAVLVMVPLIYLVVAVASVQRASAAAGDAARAAGRALATSDTVEQGVERAESAVRITLEDANLTAEDAELRFVEADADCEGDAIDPTLSAGDVYAVCVIVHTEAPAVPRFFGGGGVTAIGRYVVHVDDFRG